MSNKNKSVEFDYFLQFFPVISLPFTLTDDLQMEFSKNNHALPEAAIAQFIGRYEPSEMDDFTEYVPCFRLPSKDENTEFEAVVYWKAGLMTYDYVLATYSKQGSMLDKRAIAGTRVVGQKVQKMIATIKEDFSIYAAEGATEAAENYEANTSKVTQLELLDSGRIA